MTKWYGGVHPNYTLKCIVNMEIEYVAICNYVQTELGYVGKLATVKLQLIC